MCQFFQHLKRVSKWTACHLPTLLPRSLLPRTNGANISAQNSPPSSSDSAQTSATSSSGVVSCKSALWFLFHFPQHSRDCAGLNQGNHSFSKVVVPVRFTYNEANNVIMTVTGSASHMRGSEFCQRKQLCPGYRPMVLSGNSAY